MFQLDNKQPFSSSQLWTLQKKYFEEKGFEAWRLAEVPQYVTSNPRIASSYAEMIFACYKDLLSNGPINEPIYILETGAGSGRFAFYLLKRLVWLCNQASVAENTFIYILSDFTQKNLDFWTIHPCFQAYFEKGMLDIALFDMTLQEPLQLQLSNKNINANSLQTPLIVIANYVFDSIPQDLFYFTGGLAEMILISTQTVENPADLTAGEVLENITCEYFRQQVDPSYYLEPDFNRIMDHYRQNFTDSYVFFPAAGLRSLSYLKTFSAKGILLLTADKGEHRLYNIAYKEAPGIVRHGSFSITVNYHAFRAYCEENGGVSWFPDFQHGSINTGCVFLIEHAEQYKETGMAYQKFIAESGPDDYFTMYRNINVNMATLDAKEILSAIRFSLFDTRMLSLSLERLQQLVPKITMIERVDIINLINQCWENYFPLGESKDLANQIAMLLYDLGVYNLAIYYFQISIGLYGNDTGTMYNLAACYFQQGEKDNAKGLLFKVLELDPHNIGAQDLLLQCEG